MLFFCPNYIVNCELCEHHNPVEGYTIIHDKEYRSKFETLKRLKADSWDYFNYKNLNFQLIKRF